MLRLQSVDYSGTSHCSDQTSQQWKLKTHSSSQSLGDTSGPSVSPVAGGGEAAKWLLGIQRKHPRSNIRNDSSNLPAFTPSVWAYLNEIWQWRSILLRPSQLQHTHQSVCFHSPKITFTDCALQVHGQLQRRAAFPVRHLQKRRSGPGPARLLAPLVSCDNSL